MNLAHEITFTGQPYVAQLKLADNPPSHLPFSHFVGEKDNISRGFTQGDAIPQTYIVATPSPRPLPPPSFPTNFFMAPYPLATPPSHAMTDLKAELERCTTLPPPTQSSPNISIASHVIRSPRYAFNACHEDDAMSVEQALAPTVYSWSPKPNTPPQRLSDSSGSFMDVLKTVGEMDSRFGEMVQRVCVCHGVLPPPS